ncbi:MAG: molybdopterin-dependent oxidoreductase [Syntrophorhabdaceae bacterium]|nr:molybdopterin-dependent oxidoreductase [Syntrophorhabdaceae bacterium]
MKRRDFLHFISALTVGTFFKNTNLKAKEMERMLQNEDRKGFNIRFYKPFKPLNPAKWRLEVGGLCEHHRAFTLYELKKFKKLVQVSRMKCVECWSGKAKWGGFSPKTLFDVVKPKKEAKFLYILCGDDYTEYISLNDLLMPRVLFVYEMDDKPLPDIHGGPLRLIMPSKYGYKSAKTIVKLEFVAEEGTGYWESFGYSKDGTIQKGEDLALDLNEYMVIKKEGELEY